MRGELCQHVRWLKCPAGSRTCEQTHGGPYLPAELVDEAVRARLARELQLDLDVEGAPAEGTDGEAPARAGAHTPKASLERRVQLKLHALHLVDRGLALAAARRTPRRLDEAAPVVAAVASERASRRLLVMVGVADAEDEHRPGGHQLVRGRAASEDIGPCRAKL